MDIILDSQYYPSIPYFAQIYKCKRLIINDKELYNKQSYRNRCTILGANGSLDLIAPVNHQSPRKMQQIELNYTYRWVSVHTRSIESAYKRSPYFDYFADELLQPLLKQAKTLLELNTDILTAVCKVLQIETDILYLSEIEALDQGNTLNLTSEIHPKKNKLHLDYLPYHQVFGEQHLSNLSILDAIFCIGRETNLLFEGKM